MLQALLLAQLTFAAGDALSPETLSDRPILSFVERKLPVAGSPRGLVVDRLDAGPLPDLAVITWDSTQVARLDVLEGVGDANFQPTWGVELGFSTADHGLRAFDVDADGWLDLSAPGSLYAGALRFGDGSLAFDEGTFVPNLGSEALDLTFADFSGDGLLDALTLVSDFSSHYVDTAVNLGGSSFGNLSFATLPYVGSQPHLWSADLDGNGVAADLVVTSSLGLVVFGYASSTPPYQEFSGNFGECAALDLDGDGDLDLVATLPDAGAIRVFENSRGSGFTAGELYPTGLSPNHLVTADLDGDGDQDLAVTNGASRSVTLLLNSGAGSLHPQPAVPVGQGPGDLEAADIDLDGDMDLVIANTVDGTLSLLLNQLVR